MSRKKEIIDHAIGFFNQHGYAATTLYQLAGSMDMSRGHLTYHFKTKEDLLSAIVRDMWAGLQKKRSDSMRFPSFENLQKEIRQFREFQKTYAFVFRERQILSHPGMRDNLRQIRRDRIDDFMATLQFSREIGNLKEESIPGAYYNLCQALWMTAFYWLDLTIYDKDIDESAWDKVMWSLLLPFFTDKGKEEFITFFGQEYFDSLGVRFEAYVRKTI